MTIFFANALVFLSGVLLFDAAMSQVNVFPRLLVLMCIIRFITYSVSKLFPDPVVSIAQVIVTLGIIAMGYSLWTPTKEPASAEVG